MSKRALVLSGGGAKGAYQLGVLEHLIKNKGFDFQILAGVSVGALNATMVAQGDYDRLKELWMGLRGNEDIYQKRVLGELSVLFGADSLYKNKPLWQLIEKYVDPRKILQTGRMLKIGAVSLYTGDYQSISPSHSDFKKMVLASTTIPIAFSPINVSANSMSMVDGGVRNITPLGDVIDESPDEIIIVLCSPRTLPKGKKVYGDVFGIALRTLDILLNEIYRNDIALMDSINKVLRSVPKQSLPLEYKDYSVVKYAVIEPKSDVIDTLEFKPAKIGKAFRQGIEDAKVVFP